MSFPISFLQCIIVVSYLTIISACNSFQEENDTPKEFLKGFTKVQSGNEPLPYVGSFYLITQSNKVAEISNYELIAIHKRLKNKSCDFPTFVYQLYNGEFKLADTILNGTTLYNYNASFEKQKIETLIDQYCEKNSKTYTLKNNVDYKVQKSILYCFFKHQYFIGFDDYLGFYKLKKYEKKPIEH